jgi:hypothetical protein
MYELSNVWFEMQHHLMSIQAEVEQDRLAKLAAASPLRKERMLSVRRMAERLGDLLTGVRCRLESRLASGSAASPC